MWVCAKCREQSPDTFTVCWRCEAPKDGILASSKPAAAETIPVAEPLEEPDPIQEKQFQKPTPPYRGARWEYRWVTFDSTDAWDSEHEIRRASSVDDNEIEDWEENGPDLTSYCNEAGSEGWELVAQSFDEDGTLWVSFKRAKRS